jgi:hypothetical protein
VTLPLRLCSIDGRFFLCRWDLATFLAGFFESQPASSLAAPKKVGRYWSTRVRREFRVPALEKSEGLYWFWIGPRDEYERLIS